MPFCWTAGFAFCKVGPKFFQDSSTFSWFIAASIGLAANTSCTMLRYLHWQWSCSSRDAKRGGENWTRKKPTLTLWKWSNLERKPWGTLAHKKTFTYSCYSHFNATTSATKMPLESLHQPFRTINSWTFFSWGHFQMLHSEQYINSCS